jgi:hypothetical protein
MSFDLGSFNTLRSRLVKNSRGQWALNALATLPNEWNAVSDSVAILKQYDGGKLLQDLNEWLKTGQVPPSTAPFPNVLLAPLVVTDHVISYLDFLQAAFPDLGSRASRGSKEIFGDTRPLFGHSERLCSFFVVDSLGR